MIWKSIPDFSRYEISEFGDVRKAVGQRVGWSYAAGTLLKPSFHDRKDKYWVVHLSSDAGQSKVCKIHQLVTRTFHGPKPTPQHCALHKNDDKRNNHFSNLYWGTKKQNAIDRSINGHGRATLTKEQVLWIKELYFGDRRTLTELAEMFDTNLNVLSPLVRNKTFLWTRWWV